MWYWITAVEDFGVSLLIEFRKFLKEFLVLQESDPYIFLVILIIIKVGVSFTNLCCAFFMESIEGVKILLKNVILLGLALIK